MSLNFSHPLFKLKLSVGEYKSFMNMLPLIELIADDEEKTKALWMIGIDNEMVYDILSSHDEGLRNAFRILLFVLGIKDQPRELDEFLPRIVFVDKSFERRFRKAVTPRYKNAKVISADELNEMWKLDSAFDDGGEKIR